MKLLILDQFSELGGAQQVLLELLPAVRARGWNAVVALPGEGPLFARIHDLGFETARIDCGPYQSGRKSPADFARFALSTSRLAAQIRRLAAVDLIYANGPRLLPALALARPAAPTVFHAHSLLPHGYLRKLAGMSIQRLHATVIANCRFTAEPWREFAPISVIYNGVDAPRPTPPRPSALPGAGCIGRIAPEKGQLEFVHAAEQIHQAFPHCRLVIHGAPLHSGEAYAAQVRHAARNLPIQFAGWTDDVDSALSQLDVLLVPSAPQEATTRVILEAFAARVPVVAFRSGGIPEIIQDGRTGCLAATTDEMAHAAIDLLSNQDRRRAIAAAAHQSWLDRFTLERFHSALLTSLERAARPSST